MPCRLGSLLRRSESPPSALPAGSYGPDGAALARSLCLAPSFPPSFLPSLLPSVPPSFPPAHPPSLPPFPSSLLFVSSLPLSLLPTLFHRRHRQPAARTRVAPGGTSNRPPRQREDSDSCSTGRAASPGRAEPVRDAGRLRPSASRPSASLRPSAEPPGWLRVAPLRRAGHAAHGPARRTGFFAQSNGGRLRPPRRPAGWARHPQPSTHTRPRGAPQTAGTPPCIGATCAGADGRHTALHTCQGCRRRRPAHRPTGSSRTGP